ncbi:MAG: thymidylate kinase [Candidatus Angelobacter sp.]|jgi:dTMP kinase|nr:thymidylate kinase [Candidatus Angelobacter sp.]
MTSKRGKFITFEGLDGSGKTTQLEKLATALQSEGRDVLITREPGGTAIGEKIRAVLLDSRTAGLAPLAELALMFASRAQQIHQVILPALKQGKFVLCDRFTDSSEAYQGGGRQLGAKAVLQLHKVLCGNLQPDLTILMISDAASVHRARKREDRKRDAGKSDEGRFEMEAGEFFDRVLKAYLAIAKREPSRVVKVNATQSIAAVHQEIMKAFRKRVLTTARNS